MVLKGGTAGSSAPSETSLRGHGSLHHALESGGIVVSGHKRVMRHLRSARIDGIFENRRPPCGMSPRHCQWLRNAPPAPRRTCPRPRSRARAARGSSYISASSSALAPGPHETLCLHGGTGERGETGVASTRSSSSLSSLGHIHALAGLIETPGVVGAQKGADAALGQGRGELRGTYPRTRPLTIAVPHDDVDAEELGGMASSGPRGR